MKPIPTFLLLAGCCVVAASGQAPATGIAPTPENIERARKRLADAWSSLDERPLSPPTFLRQGELKAFSVPLDLDKPGIPLAASGDLYDPPSYESENGELKVTLTVAKTKNHIGDDPVYLRSYNGYLVGPTLRARPGDTLRITLSNGLEPQLSFSGTTNTLNAYNTINLHTHGLQVSPTGVSDNVLLEVGPGATQEYVIRIPEDHDAGTFWYHTHRHGSTAAQVGSGMSGTIIIRGKMDEIPALKSARERVMVLQQIPYVYKHPGGVLPGTEPVDLPRGVIEEQYMDVNFSPRSWDAMKRHVTINGLKLPVIRMKPGTLERWRLVDSALREEIVLSLRRIDEKGGSAPATLDFHEIAVDGLCLGKVTKKENISLWPGYRSDVLIQAPKEPGTRYLLRDERSNIAEENRRAIAIIDIEGDPAASLATLPADAELKPFERAPLAAPAEGTLPRFARYGIRGIAAGQPRFTISDSEPLTDAQADEATFISFNHEKVTKPATLGMTEDWVLSSENQGISISHPFHIHVNPFQILSATKADGTHDERYGLLPMWRDTLIIHTGTTLKIRTKYEKHPGLFVQHCHILDHEDQGMMKLVEIREKEVATADATLPAVEPYPAPPWKLRDLAGNERQSTEYTGRKVVLNFIEGYACLRCSEQLSELVKMNDALLAAGLQVIVVTPDRLEKLQASVKESDFPFPILANPDLSVFRAYGCAMGTPLHGTYLIDADGTVNRQTVSAKPFMGLKSLVEDGKELSAR